MPNWFSVFEIDGGKRKLLVTTPDREQAFLLAVAMEPSDLKPGTVSGKYEIADEDGTILYPRPAQVAG